MGGISYSRGCFLLFSGYLVFFKCRPDSFQGPWVYHQGRICFLSGLLRRPTSFRGVLASFRGVVAFLRVGPSSFRGLLTLFIGVLTSFVVVLISLGVYSHLQGVLTPFRGVLTPTFTYVSVSLSSPVG